MLHGVKEIVTTLTMSDEYGIYRRTRGGQMYCLFTCDDEEQATKIGVKLARLLARPFVNQFADSKKSNGTKAFSSVRRKK